MVQSGFFWTGGDDVVQCFSCGIKLCQWKEDSIPDIDHLTYSPDCSFIIKKTLSMAISQLSLFGDVLKENIKINTRIQSLERAIYNAMSTSTCNTQENDVKCESCKKLLSTLQKVENEKWANY